MMKKGRLLVIFHVYYHDRVDYFINKLKNIKGCRWDFVATYSEYSAETEAKLKAFKPDVRLIEVENVGYDVWPFIKVLETVDMSRYEYLMKIHTKRDIDKKTIINRIRLDRYGWRELLVEAMLKSPMRFRRCMSILKRKDVGMVCCYELLKKLDNILPEDTWQLKEEAERVSIRIDGPYFCAGTMFMARVDAMKKIMNAGLDVNSWDRKSKSDSIGTLAHVYERLVCFAVWDAGYRIVGVGSFLTSAVNTYFFKNVRPVRKRLKRRLKI